MREAVAGRDPAAAEVAYQDRVAELAEIAGGPDHTPGSAEPIAVLEVPDVGAGWSEEFDETEPSATDRIVPERVLLRVSDEKCSAYVLNVKRGKAVGNLLRVKSFLVKLDAMEIRVIDFDSGEPEVRDIEEPLPIDFGRGDALVHGAIGAAMVGIFDVQNGVGGARGRTRSRFQPEIVPSSVANKKTAGLVGATWKS